MQGLTDAEKELITNYIREEKELKDTYDQSCKEFIETIDEMKIGKTGNNAANQLKFTTADERSKAKKAFSNFIMNHNETHLTRNANIPRGIRNIFRAFESKYLLHHTKLREKYIKLLGNKPRKTLDMLILHYSLRANNQKGGTHKSRRHRRNKQKLTRKHRVK